MTKFSDRLEIAATFVKHIDDLNNARSKFKINPDPLTFLGWLESEGLINDQACERKAAEYRLMEDLKK